MNQDKCILHAFNIPDFVDLKLVKWEEMGNFGMITRIYLIFFFTVINILCHIDQIY